MTRRDQRAELPTRGRRIAEAIRRPVPRDERDLNVTPLAAAANPYALLAAQLRHVPIWIFHGAMDDLVPPRDDRRTYAALTAVGADVRYTEFPDTNHNAWDPAYCTPERWPWLFAQHR